MIRLQKFLAAANVASRRQAEKLISAGKIKVNGQIITRLGTKIDENNDQVEYQNKIVKLTTDKIYLALNKPAGYLSTTTNQQGKSVLDLVKIKTRLYPAGRLDQESTGLIILTNDGEFAQKITHPKFGGEKEYFVVLDQDLKPLDIKKLKSGVFLAGKKLRPIKVTASQNKSARLILEEGVNREIRRVLGRLGYTVKKLKRIRIGKLELKDLKPGQWRKISKEDV